MISWFGLLPIVVLTLVAVPTQRIRFHIVVYGLIVLFVYLFVPWSEPFASVSGEEPTEDSDLQFWLFHCKIVAYVYYLVMVVVTLNFARGIASKFRKTPDESNGETSA